jgi:hypothetical protein
VPCRHDAAPGQGRITVENANADARLTPCLASSLAPAHASTLPAAALYRRQPDAACLLLLPAPQTSQVSFERALGTVVGGGLGFLATAAATRWWTLQATETDDIFLAVVAATAAFASVLAGQRFSLDLSAKLFVIAFILVCFSSQEGRDPLTIALTRVGGIVSGVATMLLMSILILPKSATIESLHT